MTDCLTAASDRVRKKLTKPTRRQKSDGARTQHYKTQASQNQLSTVVRFGVARGRIALHSAQPHQGHEGALLKPALGPLGSKDAYEVLYLLLAQLQGERNIKIRLPDVPVVFWNFIFEDGVVTKRIPG